jgi:hypothetical protein
MTAHIVAEPLDAMVTVSVAEPALAATIAQAISSALCGAIASYDASRDVRVVRLRTRKRLAGLGPERIAGAIVVVRVTETNARHLLELVEAVRGAGAAGVQLVWDGLTPARPCVERYVFAALERARATPSGPPVVVAKQAEPAFALTLLIAHRARASAFGERENEGRS